MAEVCWQKQYYDQKIGTVNLKPGDLILVKADAFKGKRKIKDRWERIHVGWCIRSQQTSLLQSDRPTWKVTHPPLKLTSSHHIRGWHSLVYRYPSCMGKVYQPPPMHLTGRYSWLQGSFLLIPLTWYPRERHQPNTSCIISQLYWPVGGCIAPSGGDE